LTSADGPPTKQQPARDGAGGEHGGQQIADKNRRRRGTSECREVGRYVVRGSNEAAVQDVRDSDEQPTRKSHGQENAQHGKISGTARRRREGPWFVGATSQFDGPCQCKKLEPGQCVA
jgi:hypothetical protein